jgi:hypothetical protein
VRSDQSVIFLLYVAPDPERFIGCVYAPVCAQNIKVVGCLTLGGRVCMNETLDAVPSLKGHQQKPTYVEHDTAGCSLYLFFHRTNAMRAAPRVEAGRDLSSDCYFVLIDVSRVYFMLSYMKDNIAV